MQYQQIKTDPYFYSDEKKTRNLKSGEKFKVFICPDCGRVWQSLYHEGKRYRYLEDFPKYGLVKKTCKECEVKNG